jgi:hypothetical protein
MPQGMKRNDFILKCAKRSGVSVEHLLEHHHIVHCDCSKKKCPGWRATYRLRNRRRKIGAA